MIPLNVALSTQQCTMQVLEISESEPNSQGTSSSGASDASDVLVVENGTYVASFYEDIVRDIMEARRGT